MRYLRGLICFWLIASAPLLGMTPIVQEAYLCWGDGGHVGIETGSCEPHHESSFSSSDHEESSAHADSEDHDSCGACIDIPLPSVGATQCLIRSGSGSGSPGVPVCVAHPAEPIVAGPQAAREYSRYPRLGGGDEAIASLRTVVLLI